MVHFVREVRVNSYKQDVDNINYWILVIISGKIENIRNYFERNISEVKVLDIYFIEVVHNVIHVKTRNENVNYKKQKEVVFVPRVMKAVGIALVQGKSIILVLLG